MNPFKLLNIDKDATQKDIISAVTVAMREKKYSATEIAVAQKTLLDPVSRECTLFLYHIDLSRYKDNLTLEIAEKAKTSDVKDGVLEYLEVFNY